MEAAREHGYVPNSVAKRLATGRAMAIGHVVPIAAHEMINPIFADFIAGAGETYSEAGYNMILSIVPAEEEEASYRALAAARNVDGVIVHTPRPQDKRVALLRELGLPFVVHGRTEGDQPYAWLDIDNDVCFRRATEYLLELGHRRIALLNGLEEHSFAQFRRAGVEAALRAAGIEPDPRLFHSREMTEPYGFHTTLELLCGANPPTAVLSSSVITALGVSRAIAAAGLVMGRDVSVVTHDDALGFLPNQGAVPMFTSTKSSIRAAGRRVAELLIERIEDPTAPPPQVLWEAEMILGTSTGPAPNR
jgi:LacI family transcriptional regulator